MEAKQKMRTEKELFETCNVTKAIFRLAFPTVLGQIVLVIYNMADTFFVGLTGNDAMLTSITICMPAFMFLSAISNLFGVGGASVISRALGADNRSHAHAASAFALWGCLSMTLCYSLLAWFYTDCFVDILGGTDAEVHGNAVAYMLCTVVAGGVVTSISGLLSHLIRSEGRSLHAAVGVALGGILNILLDPLFMFVLLPAGNEALGAAMATALANVVSLLYFIIVLIAVRKHSVLGFIPSKAMFMGGIPTKIFIAGLPACVMTLFENISYAVLDKLMSLSGLSAQTGIGVAKKVNMLAHCIVRGIAQGSLPLIGYNYASGNMKRMRDSVRTSHRVAVITALLCAVASMAFARPLIGVFIHRESSSLELGILFLRILCIGGPFSASAYTLISFFQATGKGMKSFSLAILRKGLVDIPLMFVLNMVLPIYGIVMATPIADLLCCVTANMMYTAFIRDRQANIHRSSVSSCL